MAAEAPYDIHPQISCLGLEKEEALFSTMKIFPEVSSKQSGHVGLPAQPKFIVDRGAWDDGDGLQPTIGASARATGRTHQH